MLIIWNLYSFCERLLRYIEDLANLLHSDLEASVIKGFSFEAEDIKSPNTGLLSPGMPIRIRVHKKIRINPDPNLGEAYMKKKETKKS